ncbi:ATP:dephospho-CoA triphosphoribosyl transferase [Posidoniimonas polymericola]|uniref:ATP:dephospho-CoA triphosphoribosyl transferase n=1 Tax=Posidoniimonas polymericola TaxID=2528002 RepID=A0A5C5YII4_9BACT|nr:triphosphoribosyl-dephospho-CoA synthase [Posidoniimonas polymericola]TWT74676.1 ATP:dephospho-CoA triphosphoribosyl transferase [Posidoniimonas polymericola]
MSPADPARPGSLGACATLACLWEATAPKPGNVYRGADFADMSYGDFVTAAVAVGQVFDSAADQTVGELTLSAVQAMRAAVAVNTHLGTILLLGPLAKGAGPAGGICGAAAAVARQTTRDDARLAYQAIRLAAPGGMGESAKADLSEQSPAVTLYEAMTLAADRDLVARQHAGGFADVAAVAAQIATLLADGAPLADAIVHAHTAQMAAAADTLIARKCGPGVAAESAARAGRVIDAGPLGSDAYQQQLADLDFWLRSDGHRRNPGATADVVAAALFCLLVEDRLSWPVRFYGAPS